MKKFLRAFPLVVAITCSGLAVLLATLAWKNDGVANNPLVREGTSTFLPVTDNLALDLTGIDVTSAEQFGDPPYLDTRFSYVEPGLADVQVTLSVTKAETPSDGTSLIPAVTNVSQNRDPGYEVATGKRFEDGHAWIVPAVSTDIDATLPYEDVLVSIHIRAEHRPYLTDIEAAKTIYEEHEDAFKTVLSRFVAKSVSVP